MTKKTKLPILSIILIISLLSSLFTKTAFGFIYNNEDYAFSNNCIINFAANGGVKQSELKMQSTNIESIRNGLTFASVFPDSPTGKSNAVLKNYGFFASDSSYHAIDKSSPINLYFNSMSLTVSGVNSETKEITNATVYLGIDWDYEYSINYELNGGINSPSNPYNYIYKTGVSGFSAPTKDYANFKGWYYDADFALPVTGISSEDSGNKTLYAKWENTHGILNFSTGTNEKISPVNVPLNAKISDYLTADKPQKDGYTFSGWGKQDLSNLSENDVMTENGFTVYALWTANEITAKEQIIEGSLGETISENSIIVENGTGEYTFSLGENETLPKGLILEDNGTISGNFEEAGNFEINIVITDKNSGSKTTVKISFDISGSPIQIKKMPTTSWVAKNKALKYSSVFGGKFVIINEEGVEEEIKGTLWWKDETTIFPEYGNYTVPVIFTPNDKNYQPFEFDMELNVKKPFSSSPTPTIKYTIRSSASDGGSITPEGRSELYEYENITYTIKADPGYRISEIIVDGEKYDGGETKRKYTFTSVTESHRIHAEFEKIDEEKTKKRFYDNENTDPDNDKAVSDNSKNKSSDKNNNTSNDNTSNKIDVSSVFNTKDKIAYIQGYNDGSFRPSNYLTRAEASVILSKILVTKMEDKNYTSKFSDVNFSDWYGNYVSFLSEQGIIDGYSDGTFKPNANITRAELVALVAKALNINDRYTNYFSDTAGMWASNAISAINSFGFIKGYADGTFRPNANITRAETTVFLNAVLGRTSSSSGEPVSNAFNDIKPTDWFYESVIEAANLSPRSF